MKLSLTQRSIYDKMSSGGSSILTSLLSLLHHGEHKPVSVYICICVQIMYCMSAWVGVLEPKFNVCQMMLQQWTWQCDFLSFYPKHFFWILVRVCVRVLVCIVSATSGADKSSRDTSILTLFSNKDHSSKNGCLTLRPWPDYITKVSVAVISMWGRHHKSQKMNHFVLWDEFKCANSISRKE